MTNLLDTRRGRLRAAAVLGGSRLLVAASALTGDPLTTVLRGSPGTDVYAAYERLRRRGDLQRGSFGLRPVTSYALSQQVLRDPRFGIQAADGSRPQDDAVTAAANGPLAGSFLDVDPPDHTRLRRVAAPAFRPTVIRAMAPEIEELLLRLLDRAARQDRVDLMAEVAAPFPIAVISRLLGIPAEDTVQFRRIGLLVGQSLDGVRTLAQARLLRKASQELNVLFRRLADERRVDPRDDVISRLAAAESDGRLVASDLSATCGLLLVAGFETTVNLIGNGIGALLGGPTPDRTRWRELATNTDLAARVTEETLRWDPPVQLTARTAQSDVELAGQRLSTGTVVLLALAAANRDPMVYDDPVTFDPERTGVVEHLSFSSGIHYCLGAPLARLEGELAFRALAERAQGMRLLPGARRRRGATIRGYASLPVSFT